SPSVLFLYTILLHPSANPFRLTDRSLPDIRSNPPHIVTALQAVRRIAFPQSPASARISRTFWRNVPTCYPVESNSGRDGSPSRPSNCVFPFGRLRQNKSDVLEKRPYLLSGRIQLR